jgi:hypothetical protein
MSERSSAPPGVAAEVRGPDERTAVRSPRGVVALAGALVAALVLLLQFGPGLSLLAWRATGWQGFALAGALRDAVIATMLGVAIAASLAARLGRRVPAQAPGGPAPWTWLRALVAASLAWVVVVGAYALMSPADPALVALNARRLVLFPLLVIAVLGLPRLPPRRWSRGVLASGGIVAALALAGLAAPAAWWEDTLEVVAFTAANPLDPFGALPFAESGRFHSWDLEAWLGTPVRRAIGPALEPTTLAAGLAAAFALAGAERAGSCGARRRRLGALMGLLAIAGLATLSKAFVLFLVLLAAWLASGLPSPRRPLWLAAAGFGLALAADRQGWTEGPFEHLAGLQTAVTALAEGEGAAAWFGQGLGMAGNYAALEGDADLGAESGLGNTLAQLGWPGLALLAWSALLARALLDAPAGEGLAGPAARRWLAGWLLAWQASFVVSASSLGAGGNALGFLVIALALRPGGAAGVPTAGAERRADPR